MYVANLLAYNSQELEKLNPRFASSCEYRISSYNLFLFLLVLFFLSVFSESSDVNY